MSKKVNSVEITFENLDYVNVPAEFFGTFQIVDIHISVERLALNAILQRTYADHAEFEMLVSVDSELSRLTHDLSFTPDEQSSLLKRIANRRDITSLSLHYDDGTIDHIYLPWEDATNETNNQLLSANFTKVGNLLVTIRKQ
jgi:hypothetical protein